VDAALPEGDWVTPVSPPVVEGAGHVAACVVASCIVGAGAALGSWWLIGDQSVHTRSPEDLDYAFRAPTVPHWVFVTFGPIGFVAAVASLSWLVIAASRLVIDRRWLQVASLLALAGFLLAVIGRVATAGSIGANIGGGLGILLLPAVAGLAVRAAFVTLRISDARRSQLASS